MQNLNNNLMRHLPNMSHAYSNELAVSPSPNSFPILTELQNLILRACTCTKWTRNELQGVAVNWTALRPKLNMYTGPRPNGMKRPKVRHRKIRPRTRRNHESSWVWGEDGEYHPPHKLATGGRPAKSHRHNYDVAAFYGDAPWCIRTFISMFRAIQKYQNRTQNHASENLHMGVHWFDRQIGQIPCT